MIRASENPLGSCCMTVKGSPTAQFRIDAAQALRQSLFLAELSEMTLDEFSYLMGDLLRDETDAINSSVRILAHPEAVVVQSDFNAGRCRGTLLCVASFGRPRGVAPCTNKLL